MENIYSALGINSQISTFMNRVLQHRWLLRDVYHIMVTLTMVGKLLVSPGHKVEMMMESM